MTKQLRMTMGELDDKCDNLFSLGKFSQILALAHDDYEVPDYWMDRIQFMEVVLHTLGLSEELLVQYIDALYQMDLDFEYTEFITNDVNLKGVLRIQIVLHKKHQTEGGRMAMEIAEFNRKFADRFTAEQRRTLSALTFTIYVDDYDDDVIEVDENDPEMVEDDPLCDVEGTCYCHACVAARDSEVGDEDVQGGPDDYEGDADDTPPPRNRMH